MPRKKSQTVSESSEICSDNLKYPKGERVFTGYYDSTGALMYIITSKEPAREWYYLYKLIGDGTFKKLGKAREPPELLDKHGVYDDIWR